MMQRPATAWILATALIAGTVFGISASDADEQSTAAAPAQAEIVEESMHEFMEYVFQPTYRRLKTAMASAPTDKAGWKAIKSDALILAEASNLLFARAPESDVADWNQHSAASRSGGADLYRAAGKNDFNTATTAWKRMLENCNACHRQFEEGRHILTP